MDLYGEKNNVEEFNDRMVGFFTKLLEYLFFGLEKLELFQNVS